MNRHKKIIVALSLFCIVLTAAEIVLVKMLYNPNPLPETGVIPNEDAAIKFAEAIWLPLYGDRIYNGYPIVAFYDGKTDQWFVRGTLPRVMMGSWAEIRFIGTDARILHIGY